MTMDLCDTLSAVAIHVSWLWPIVKVTLILILTTIASFILTALLVGAIYDAIDATPGETSIVVTWLIITITCHLTVATLMGWITWA